MIFSDNFLLVIFDRQFVEAKKFILNQQLDFDLSGDYFFVDCVELFQRFARFWGFDLLSENLRNFNLAVFDEVQIFSWVALLEDQLVVFWVDLFHVD